MTQRYAHLPPAQKLDAVQRLTRRTTGTSPEPAEERVGSRRRKSVISEKRAGDRGRTGDVQLGNLAFHGRPGGIERRLDPRTDTSNRLTFRPSKRGFDVTFREGAHEPEIRQYPGISIVSRAYDLAAE